MKQFFFNKQNFSIFDNTLPEISGIHPLTYHRDTYYFPHMHNMATIVFQLNGQSEQWIGCKKYEMHKGDIFIINKGDIHTEKGLERDKCKFIGISFDRTNLADLEDGRLIPKGSSHLVHCQENVSEIMGMLREIELICWEKSDYCNEISKLNTMKLMYYIYRNLQPDSENSDGLSELTGKIKAYIDEHYNEPFSNEQLAGKFYISSSLLIHKMKSEMNCSPRSYQIDRRVGEAQFKLMHTEKTVSDISNEVGYDNVNYFIKLFRERTGFSPLEFRQKMSPEQNTII